MNKSSINCFHVITPATPLWLVAATFFRNQKNQLEYAFDWTPVLALATHGWRTVVLIAHYEYATPVWIEPSIDEWQKLDQLIDGSLDELIHISRVVIDRPADDADDFTNTTLFNGLLLHCDERIDQFEYVEELSDQELCWSSLRDRCTTSVVLTR